MKRIKSFKLFESDTKNMLIADIKDVISRSGLNVEDMGISWATRFDAEWRELGRFLLSFKNQEDYLKVKDLLETDGFDYEELYSKGARFPFQFIVTFNS